MIISNSQVQSILRLQINSYQKNNTVEAVSASKADSLELSSRAKEMKLAKEMILKSPEIRADKVNELKMQIREGKYQVSASDIAEKIIDRSLVDELARR